MLDLVLCYSLEFFSQRFDRKHTVLLNPAGWLYNPSSTVKINSEGEDSTSHEGRRGVWVDPADQWIVRAAVIGTPNAGKSTLANQLLGRKVAAVIPNSNSCRDHCMLLSKVACSCDYPSVVPRLVSSFRTQRRQKACSY